MEQIIKLLVSYVRRQISQLVRALLFNSFVCVFVIFLFQCATAQCRLYNRTTLKIVKFMFIRKLQTSILKDEIYQLSTLIVYTEISEIDGISAPTF